MTFRVDLHNNRSIYRENGPLIAQTFNAEDAAMIVDALNKHEPEESKPDPMVGDVWEHGGDTIFVIQDRIKTWWYFAINGASNGMESLPLDAVLMYRDHQPVNPDGTPVGAGSVQPEERVMLTGDDPEPPHKSVVIDRDGDSWQRREDRWCYQSNATLDWAGLQEKYGPVELLKRGTE